MTTTDISNYNFFFGVDTYLTNIEVGIDKEGNQFSRAYVYNGYGKAWGKWELLEEKKPIEVGPEGEVRMKWGWNWLTGVEGARLRLPKIKK